MMVKFKTRTFCKYLAIALAALLSVCVASLVGNIANPDDAYAAVKKKITNVKVNKIKFTQTDISKPVTPTFTVYKGKKKLSSKNYKLTYYEKQFRGSVVTTKNGKTTRKNLYKYVKVKSINVPLGQTSYTTFKVVAKGKGGYKGSISKTFKVKSAWSIKKPKGWKVGVKCGDYTTMWGSPFRCLDKFEPVYDESGKLLRYETCCGKYTVRK